MSLVKLIYRENVDAASPFAEAKALAKAELPQAGRFRVNQDIMDAVDRMEAIPIDDLLKAMPYARLPFASTWIEWANPEGGGHIGYLIQSDDQPDSFRFRRYLSMRGIEDAAGHAVVADLDWVKVSPYGYSTDVPPVKYPAPLVTVTSAGARDTLADQTFAEDVRTTVSDVVGMVLIINSPSGVVEIAPPADTAKEDARRKRDGRMPLPNLREIRLNIGRGKPEGRGTDGGDPEGRARAEHFVRGHFKLINSKMRWWSPHIRNQAGETPAALPRDYSVGV